MEIEIVRKMVGVEKREIRCRGLPNCRHDCRHDLQELMT
jgi:hypothetical protein